MHSGSIPAHLHLLGIEADRGGLGNTLTTSATWWSHAFRAIKSLATGSSLRSTDCEWSLRRYGCSLAHSCSLTRRLWSWSRGGRGVVARDGIKGGGVMNSITVSDLEMGSDLTWNNKIGTEKRFSNSNKWKKDSQILIWTFTISKRHYAQMFPFNVNRKESTRAWL